MPILRITASTSGRAASAFVTHAESSSGLGSDEMSGARRSAIAASHFGANVDGPTESSARFTLPAEYYRQ